MSVNREGLVPVEKLEALANTWQMLARSVPSMMAAGALNDCAIELRALLAESREGGKPLVCTCGDDPVFAGIETLPCPVHTPPSSSDRVQVFADGQLISDAPASSGTEGPLAELMGFLRDWADVDTLDMLGHVTDSPPDPKSTWHPKYLEDAARVCAALATMEAMERKAGGLCTQGVSVMTREELWGQAFIETLRKNGKEGTAEKAAAEADVALASFDKIKKSE